MGSYSKAHKHYTRVELLELDLVVSSNKRLEWRWLRAKNTQANSGTELITTAKRFNVQTPEEDFIVQAQEGTEW